MPSEAYLTEISGCSQSCTQQAPTEPAVLQKSNRTTCSKPGEVSEEIIQIILASPPCRLLPAVRKIKVK